MEGFPGNLKRNIKKVALVASFVLPVESKSEPMPNELPPAVAVVAPVENEYQTKQVKQEKRRQKKTKKQFVKPKVSSKGSPAAMQEQFQKAKEADYDRLRNTAEIKQYLRLGLLVRISGNENYRLHKVNFPYARPEVKILIERFSQQYRASCGEKMVITSLARPLNRQPGNASKLSVHPAGMSVDFRISKNSKCRQFFEETALALESKKLIQYTKERFPPHYHIAVYPEYKDYVARKRE